MAITDYRDWVGIVEAFAERKLDLDTAMSYLDQMLGPTWRQNPTVVDGLKRASLILQPQSTTAPGVGAESTAGLGSLANRPQTSDIITRYRAGQFGAMGTEGAKDQAIVEIARALIAQGFSRDQAYNSATTEFNKYFPGSQAATGAAAGGLTAGISGGLPADAGAGTRTPARGGAGAAVGGGFGAQAPLDPNAELAREESDTAEGRARIYTRYLASKLPGDTPGLVREMLEAQQPALGNAFTMQRGLGDINPDTSYNQFLSPNPGRVDPGAFGGLVDRTRAFLNRAPQTSDSPANVGFRQQMGNPSRQYELALRAAQMNVPQEFKPGFGTAAGQTFNQYLLGNALGQQGFDKPFLEYINPQNQASGAMNYTTPRGLGLDFNLGNFRNMLNSASALVGGPSAGLTDLQKEYRQRLIDDPESQFTLALQAALPALPFQARQGFRQMAEDEFRRFQATKGVNAPFLPGFVSRGYNFFGG